MLFNSLEFLIFFLPLVLGGYFLIAKNSQKMALTFLVCASAVFIAWKVPAFLFLIAFSIVVNYLIFRWMQIIKSKEVKRTIFLGGMLFNVFYLFYFKYFNFFISSCNSLFSLHLQTHDILLPLAISFYTFQQISFLHDALNEKVKPHSFLDYSLFVLFFPQLIAGPILRHDELDFSKPHPHFENLAVGLSIFSMGLVKKVVFADTVGALVNTRYGQVLSGQPLECLEAWIAICAFSFQIYFDFSGYSDMAVGLGRLFNMKFPQNFNSPYQATSIIDFWRRWHISLSTFLKENLYIPLGGARKGPWRKGINLMTTMLLGGLWHGASWTFVAWGGLHGAFLIFNHLLPKERKNRGRVVRLGKQCCVFLLVSLAWVFFRAENFSVATSVYASAFGGLSLGSISAASLQPFLPLGALLCVVLFLPNTFDWHWQYGPSLDYRPNTQMSSLFFQKLSWRPTKAWSFLILLMLFLSFSLISGKQEFIYFQF